MRLLKNLYHFFESLFWVLWYRYPAKNLIVIGVTGTDGKTTTCHLIYEILKKAGIKVALVSTVAAYIGDEEIDTGFHVTTANAKILQPLLKKIVDRGFTHVVLEVTSHSLDQYRVVGCNFFIGAVTNITHEHLDYHGTFEKYREAKAKLVLVTKYSVLNIDDPSFDYLKQKTSGKVIPYTKSKLNFSNSHLVGEYNLYNISAATEVAKVLGVQFPVISSAVNDFPGVPGRTEEIKNNKGIKIIVDFAHTPNALEQVLRALKTQNEKHKRMILVFGCAGLRDHTKRPMMGEIAVKYADKVIITAEDPRTEKLEDIYRDITSLAFPPLKLRGGTEEGDTKEKVFREDDRQKAIALAIKSAKKGDTIVITGKGHEKSMCFGIIEYPWSDKEVVQKAL